MMKLETLSVRQTTDCSYLHNLRIL